MKLKKLIEDLQEVFKEHGDLDVVITEDTEEAADVGREMVVAQYEPEEGGPEQTAVFFIPADYLEKPDLSLVN